MVKRIAGLKEELNMNGYGCRGSNTTIDPPNPMKERTDYFKAHRETECAEMLLKACQEREQNLKEIYERKLEIL